MGQSVLMSSSTSDTVSFKAVDVNVDGRVVVRGDDLEMAMKGVVAWKALAHAVDRRKQPRAKKYVMISGYLIICI